MQTENPDTAEKYNQAPDDQMYNYNIKPKSTYEELDILGGRKKNQQELLEAINLKKFISKAIPVVEKVLDENQEKFFKMNRDQAAKRNAVEMRTNIKLPVEILHLFGEKNPQSGEYVPAEIVKISSAHFFESCP